MARTAITIVDAPLNEAVALEAFSSAASLSDGFEFDYDGADNRTAFLIQNSATSAGTITFKKGDAIQGVADIEYSIDSGTTAVVWVDSGLIKNVANADKGKVVAIPSASTIKVAAVHLGRIASASVTW